MHYSTIWFLHTFNNNYIATYVSLSQDSLTFLKSGPEWVTLKNSVWLKTKLKVQQMSAYTNIPGVAIQYPCISLTHPTHQSNTVFHSTHRATANPSVKPLRFTTLSERWFTVQDGRYCILYLAVFLHSTVLLLSSHIKKDKHTQIQRLYEQKQIHTKINWPTADRDLKIDRNFKDTIYTYKNLKTNTVQEPEIHTPEIKEKIQFLWSLFYFIQQGIKCVCTLLFLTASIFTFSVFLMETVWFALEPI